MPRSRSRRSRLAAVSVLALAAVLALGACGRSGGGTTTSATSTPSASVERQPTGSVTVDGVTVSGAPGTAPVVTVAAGATAPQKLVVEDVVEGTGTEAKAGDTITANYVGYGLKTGQQFDSSWDRGTPAQFPLDGVIKGWQEGIPGMKVGRPARAGDPGRRRLRRDAAARIRDRAGRGAGLRRRPGQRPLTPPPTSSVPRSLTCTSRPEEDR